MCNNMLIYKHHIDDFVNVSDDVCPYKVEDLAMSNPDAHTPQFILNELERKANFTDTISSIKIIQKEYEHDVVIKHKIKMIYSSIAFSRLLCLYVYKKMCVDIGVCNVGIVSIDVLRSAIFITLRKYNILIDKIQYDYLTPEFDVKIKNSHISFKKLI